MPNYSNSESYDNYDELNPYEAFSVIEGKILESIDTVAYCDLDARTQAWFEKQLGDLLDKLEEKVMG
jgi:hypothetical protein